MSEKELILRKEIIQAGQLLYQKSLVTAKDGNISARLDDKRVLITPSGLCKGMMQEEQLIIIDLKGNRVDTPNRINQYLRPSSETFMHLQVYKQRSDVQAVVHAHPLYTVALSIADIPLTNIKFPEAIMYLGFIPTTEYATPASLENVDVIRDLINEHDALILKRHGTITVGESPLDAYFKTEILEYVGKSIFLLECLGEGTKLSLIQVQKLLSLRKNMGNAKAGELSEFLDLFGVRYP